MKSELTQSAPTRVSTFTYLAKGSLSLVLLLALASATRFAHGQTLTVLYSFTGYSGGEPSGGVIRDTAGNFYGTTKHGGIGDCGDGCGTVFRLSAAGKHKVLHRFTGGADGATPWAGFIRDATGNLYSITPYGGNFICGGGCGTIFKVDAAGNETVLYSFSGPPDGWVPEGDLIRDASGNLYGTTADGGDPACNTGYGCGTVFKLDASNNETVLYRFSGGVDGRFPSAGVIRDAAGNLFGTTSNGGAFGFGTVFKVDKPGHEIVLHSFTGSPDGNSPSAPLAQVGANLYGTTVSGGAFGFGTVFKVDKTGKETVVYSFAGGTDGAYPGGLISDAAGNLYGTSGGGPAGLGTVFKLDNTGNETVLHSFAGGLDGYYPWGRLFRDAAGNLYGTTLLGGAHGYGTVFKITP